MKDTSVSAHPWPPTGRNNYHTRSRTCRKTTSRAPPDRADYSEKRY